MSEESPPLLRVRRLGKRFAAPVLVDVDLEILPGEVHALVGGNGAGKSTLARILCGLLPSDGGELYLHGRLYAPRSKREAEESGVQMVMQELNLISTLSVAENIYLNRLPRRFGVVNYRTLVDDTIRLLPRVGLEDVDPLTPVGGLGVGQQQLVEIAAALSRACRLLILDEPTAALTEPQVDLLFQNIRRLQMEGVGFLYISHRMEEIRRLADRVTVLRDGRNVATHRAAETTIDRLMREMAGQDLEASVPNKTRDLGAVALRVKSLCRGPQVRDVSFDVRAGEIFGLAGLIGSGRTETLRAIFGAEQADRGEIFLGDDCSPTLYRQPEEAVRAGIGLVSEDRKKDGLLLPLSVAMNASLTHLGQTARGWHRVNRVEERQGAQAWCRQLAVHFRSLDQPVMELSGGNQQKIVMARWLWQDCRILLFDEPTRGIDVAAKQTIYRLIEDLARAGKAIVLVSSELEELTALCDRIGVMSAGRLVRIFQRGEWTRESLTACTFSEHLRAVQPANPMTSP